MVANSFFSFSIPAGWILPVDQGGLKDQLTSTWNSISAFPKWLTIPIALPAVYYTARYLWELPKVGDLNNKVVFLAGADSGFGYLTVVKCAQEGMTVFAGCLSQQGRSKLLQENDKLKGRGRIIPLELDVSKKESCEAAREFVEQSLGPNQYLWAIILNAGMLGWYGPDAWLDVEQEYMPVMNVNAFGQVRMVHAFLPLLKRSKGRIISASSIVGRIAIQHEGAYAMSKYAVEAYMDTIRMELYNYGITVCILEPTGFNTGMHNLPAFRREVERVWERMSPEMREEYGEAYKEKYITGFANFPATLSKRVDYVVDAYYHAATACFPRYRYRVGWGSLFIWIPLSYLPTGLQDFMMRRLTKYHLFVPAALKEKK